MADDRAKNLAKDEEVREDLLKLYQDIAKGFDNQYPRAEKIEDNWKLFRSITTDKQKYCGRNDLFIPIVYDAVRARATRFTNQLFPQNGRHIECISSDGTLPRATISILEAHIRKARLREYMPALLIAGDVEGNYNVYVEWQDSKRYTTKRVKKSVEAIPGVEAGKVDDIEEEVISVGGPCIDIIPDTDICVLPATSASIEEAISNGGSVTIVRRWNKERIKKAIKNKEIEKKEGEELLDNMDKRESQIYKDSDKEAAKAAGVKKDGRGLWTMVYETWTLLETEEGERLCKVLYGSDTIILTARRNPLWCDKLPLLSVPVQKQPGTCKGEAPVSSVADMQYYANDIINEAADASAYALLPILLRDPESSTAPLVLSPGAIWDVPPDSVAPLSFPPVWEKGFEILADIQQKIEQTLAVSPAMIAQGPQKTKKNQAEIAQQQQVELLQTADAVTVIEHGILSPLVELFLDLDYQYRDVTMLVHQYGQMGAQAAMEEVPPLQNDTRFVTRWVGVEVSRNAQLMQQKISALNLLMSLPPALYPDYVINAQPLIVDIAEAAYGSQQARLILQDQRSLVSQNPDTENMMMQEGLFVDTHPMDNDMEHINSHTAFFKANGDDSGLTMQHIEKHKKQAMMKMIAQKMAMNPNAQQGQGAGGGSPEGQPGQTPPGAKPQPMTGNPQQPPGAIHQDQLKDPNAMPRKM